MGYYIKKSFGVTISLTVLLMALLLMAACSPFNQQNPEIPGKPSNHGEKPQQEQKSNLAVYYAKMTDDDAYLVREVHEVPYTKEVARAALEELVRGIPSTSGAVRILPPGTQIKSINVRDGHAVVDFSREVLHANVGASGEALGIQSIVNTLTEFPSINKVSFLVEGKVDEVSRDWWGHVGLYSQPFTRDISVVFEPVIWVTAPVSGQKVSSPIEIQGTARVFEAAVSARLRDDSGKVLGEGFATATEGAPGRGEFVLSLPFDAASPGSGRVEVFWGSPKDGSDLDVIEIPVTW